MIILRVETLEGQGPYRGGQQWVRDMFCGSRHPTPSEDSGMAKEWDMLDWGEQSEYLFGFKSRDQYEAWFYNASKLCIAHQQGFRLAHYYVPFNRVIVGRAQAVFHKDYAKLIKRTALLPELDE